MAAKIHPLLRRLFGESAKGIRVEDSLLTGYASVGG